MSYQEQFDRAKTIPTLERMHMAIMAQAVVIQEAIGASPTAQEVRDSLLAYQVLRNPTRWRALFTQTLLAKNDTVDPTAIADSVLLSNVAGIWQEIAGVVTETPVPLPE